jgi:antitoxin FitA
VPHLRCSASYIPRTQRSRAGLKYAAPPALAYISVVALSRLFASDASNAIIDDMAALTIRKLDQKTKTRLRVRAAHHGRSMEEEAREILRSALTTSPRTNGNLAEAIRRRFASFGGIEISLPQRDAVRKAPGFEE